MFSEPVQSDSTNAAHTRTLSASDGNQALRRRGLVSILSAAVVSVGAIWFAHARELGPIDDAFISLRYAENWAAGRGLVFNPGETVEGYTNFLFVAMEAIAIRGGVESVTAMVSLSWLSLACLAAVFASFASEHLFRDKPMLAAAGAVALCLNPVMICWGASGLEGCLYAALVLASVHCAAGLAGQVRPVSSAVFLVLAGMTRPETPAWMPILAGLILWQTRSVRSAATFAGIFAVAFGIYFSARAIHFGHLFPNTFYAKLDYGNEALAYRGIRYVGEFMLGAWPLATMALGGACLLRRGPRWAVGLAVLVMAQTAVVAYEGGDHFAMFRFMAPVLPLLAVLALYPACVAAERWGRQSTFATAATLAGLLAIGGSGVLAGARIKPDEPARVTQFQRFLQEVECARQWSRLGQWLQRHAPADASLATIAIGAVGFYSDLRIIDPHGIVDPVIAHRRQQIGGGYAGHEKFDLTHLMEKRPSYLLLLNRLTDRPADEASLGEEVWGDFNHAILTDPRLAEGYRYERIRVGDQYLNLHVRGDLPTPGRAPAIVRSN